MYEIPVWTSRHPELNQYISMVSIDNPHTTHPG
jgi:hypothetical protein